MGNNFYLQDKGYSAVYARKHFLRERNHKTSSAILYVINRMREEIFLEEDINKTYNMDRMQLKIVVILYLQGE